MSKQPITITLETETLDALDATRGRHALSRSTLIQMILLEWVNGSNEVVVHNEHPFVARGSHESESVDGGEGDRPATGFAREAEVARRIQEELQADKRGLVAAGHRDPW